MLGFQEYAKTSTPPREHVNLYRDLVEKYEALKKVQKDIRPGKMHNTSNMTLQEELAMSGDFKDTDEESGHGDSLRTEQQKKGQEDIFADTNRFLRGGNDQFFRLLG